jgi:hypothetical protein
VGGGGCSPADPPPRLMCALNTDCVCLTIAASVGKGSIIPINNREVPGSLLNSQTGYLASDHLRKWSLTKTSFGGSWISFRPQIRHFLRNPTFYYTVFKIPPHELILSQINPINIFTPYFFKMYFTVILPSTFRFRKWFSSFGLPNNIWCNLQIIMFILTQSLSCDHPKFTHCVSAYEGFFPPPASSVTQDGDHIF